MAAALAALHDHRVDAPLRDLLGVALGADRRDDDHARRPCSSLDQRPRSAPARTTRRARRSRIIRSMRSAASAWSARRLTPNGLSVRSLTSLIARAQLVERHRRRREDAERRRPSAVAAVSRGAGDPAHARLHDRVLARRTGRTAACAARRARQRRDFGLASAFGIDHRRRSGAARRRSAGATLGTSSGMTSSKPVAATTSSTVTPGCTERRRMRWSGVSKSSTPRLRDDAADLVEPRRTGPSSAARS